MGADEAGTLAALKACETEVIEPVVERHGGRIVKRMGDGYLVEFASVVAAVECALTWQAGTLEPLAFRIGIHIGDVMVQEGDLYGDGVNVAARLEALALPGGLCLSEDAQRQVRGKTSATFKDMGTQQLKNIAEPLRVYRTVPAEGSGDADDERTSAMEPKPGGTAWRMPRVLVAPFRPLGAQADAEALASGLTETLAAALAHFEEFELIDPGSASGAIADKGALAAGRALGATYVLEGTLQIALGKARIGVQLVDVANGERVWSEKLDRSLDDVFALQDDITDFVASTMGEAVGEEQARAISDKPDAELTAYELMVRGMQHLHRVNAEDNRIARSYFERLLERKPNHYFPTLCLCWTYAIESFGGWPTRPDPLGHAMGLLRPLLRQHDRSAHLHRLMARLCLQSGDLEQGLAHAERAYRLNPHHSDMVLSYGVALLWIGRTREGLERLERAYEVNPYAPPYYRAHLSLGYFLVGRHLDGIEVLSGIQGAILNSRFYRIANLAALERLDEAKAEATTVLREDPDFDLARLLSNLPFGKAEDRQRFADALKRAGLE